MLDLLYPSQKKQLSKKLREKIECLDSSYKNIIVNDEQKKKIRDLIINAIITDSRSFGDFKKSGISKLFSYISEEFGIFISPPTRPTITKYIEIN